MIGARKRPNEPFEKMLRRFSKAVDTSGVLSDLRNYQQYEKPSEKRKKRKERWKLEKRKNKSEEEAKSWR